MDWKGSPGFHPRLRTLCNETVLSRLFMNFDPKEEVNESLHWFRELWALVICELVLWELESLNKSFTVSSLDLKQAMIKPQLPHPSPLQRNIESHHSFNSCPHSTLQFFPFCQMGTVRTSYNIHYYTLLRPHFSFLTSMFSLSFPHWCSSEEHF